MSHAKDFSLESGDEQMARQLAFDYRSAQLSEADRALCDYAVKLTLNPGSMESHDVDLLREHGFSDEQITVATQVIGYFNYITRIVQSLGADPEPWMNIPMEEWKANKKSEWQINKK
jgi:uncharacterized peroxidase-related enzyme